MMKFSETVSDQQEDLLQERMIKLLQELLLNWARLFRA